MSIITLKQLKSSLQAVKSYIDRIIPKNISELENDTGYLTGDYQPNWNANENESGYIANRTHWKDGNTEQLLIDNNDPRLQIRYMFSGGAEVECNIILDRSGKEYTVVIDDAEFICKYNSMFSNEDFIVFTGYNQNINVRLYQYYDSPEKIYIEPTESNGENFTNQTMSISILDNGSTVYTGTISANSIIYKCITDDAKLYEEGTNKYIIKFGSDEYEINVNVDEEYGLYYDEEEQIDEYSWITLYQLYNGPSYEHDGQYEFSLIIYPQVNHNGEFSISKPSSIIYHKLDNNYLDIAPVAISGNYEDLNNKPDIPVTDVQINETSILSNGVANIPIADANTYGTVKVDQSSGILLDQNGALTVKRAIDAYDIRRLNDGYRFVPIYAQHISTFYGLAKAAGDTTQSQSDNAVGAYTNEAKTAIKNMIGITDPTVLDVQMNSTSIVSSGTATIPIADDQNKLGVVKVNNSYGITVGYTGLLSIFAALSADIKAGASNVRPITPGRLDEAVFYGLTRAAGVDMASSSNTVGTYTDTAKTAIKSMLGVPNYSYDLSEGELLPANASLIDYTTPGIYYADDSTAGTISTCPTDLRFKLIVEKINDRDVRQTVIDYMGRNFTTVINTVTHDVTMWNRVATNDDLSYLVSDVQINGTSIVDEYGWANIPVASTSNFGVIKVNGNGLRMFNSGEIATLLATSTQIKTGIETYAPLVPLRQHESVFYGLAKAAGDTTQSSSSNAVGTYTDTAKTAIKTMLGIIDPQVNNVQLNGTSILSNGTANIPVANNTLGVVKVNTGTNSGIYINPVTGEITTSSASIANIKEGTNLFRPLSPGTQHGAAFYGLAKAAGDTTQASSSNTVGTYTNEAKAAIQNMLGVESVGLAVQNISDSSVTIVGEPNTKYICGEVLSIDITPPSVGTIDVIFTSGSSVAILTLPSTVKMPEWWGGVETGYTYELIISDGIYAGVMAWPQ